MAIQFPSNFKPQLSSLDFAIEDIRGLEEATDNESRVSREVKILAIEAESRTLRETVRKPGGEFIMRRSIKSQYEE